MGNLGVPELLLILILLGVLLVPGIFFLLTLQKALNRCSPESRTMPPEQVWFLLIPIFNIVWQFVVVSRVASSLGNEFRRRSLVKEPEPGKTLGLAFCILDLCGIIPILGIIASLAGLVFWIMYWVKISNYSAELAYQSAAQFRATVPTQQTQI